MIWKLYDEPHEGRFGRPFKSLTGHNHFVSDLALSFDNHYLLSSSWDKTIRLWDLRTGQTVKRFVGHTKEIYTISFSPDNRQVISAGADRGIKLWNTIGENKFTSETNNHSDWVSCVRYSPQLKQQSKVTFQPYFASVGWDGKLKIWNTNFQIRYSFKPHDGQINSVAISPNGKYLATGGKDKNLQIWDIADLKEPIRTIESSGTIHKIAFNPKYQWVGCATENGIEVWDLMSDSDKPLERLQAVAEDNKVKKEGDKATSKKVVHLTPTSFAWNALGRRLFAGYTDGKIRVWNCSNEGKSQ